MLRWSLCFVFDDSNVVVVFRFSCSVFRVSCCVLRVIFLFLCKSRMFDDNKIIKDKGVNTGGKATAS